MADLTKTNEEQERIAQQLQPVVVGNTGPAILGIKFNDRNRNGIRDSGEEGLANVPIVLTSSGTGPVSTTTDPNGAFSFINLVPGNYVITETPPPGFTPTTPNPLAVTLGNTKVNVLFGNTIIPGSQIVGCKYLDIDADGFRDGNEPGIKNVRIYLDINGNGQRDAGEPNTLTDKNGQWSFQVAPGTYKVREERIRPQIPADPNKIETNATNAEPLETFDFPQSTPPGNVPLLDVTVAANQTFACAQVGDTPLYQIEVNKFRDIDGNGSRNVVSGVLEPPIAKVPFILDVNGNGNWDSSSEPITLTDVSGVATFKNLRAGNYKVLEIFPSVLPAAVGGGVPGNLAFPVATTGNPTLVSAPGPQARFQGTISREQPLLVADSTYTLQPKDPKFVDTNRDGVQQLPGEVSIPATGVRPIFANTPFPFPATNPSPALTFTPVVPNNATGDNASVGNTLPNITVFKYNDLNGNGRYEPTQGEAPLSGISVFLDTNNNGTPQPGEPQLLTNALGRGAFTNLQPGNYTVREVVTAGFSPSTSAVVPVTLSTQDANVTFANTPNSNITGCKFEDFNLNGYRDGNEPAISGVTIAIDTDGNGVLDKGEATSITDQFGRFSFNNLPPGTYKIREVLPSGFFKTTQPVDVVLGANQTFTCALVGNSRRYDLLVRKFRDNNRSGFQDGSEGPLTNVPFTLDLNGNGKYDAATEPLVRTDAAGIARFNDLSPATYSVLEVFDTPGVPNNFPIRTGPNPVNFSVPGPNTVPTTPVTTPNPSGIVRLSSLDPVTGESQKVETDPDPLNNPGSSLDATVKASSIDTSLIAPGNAGISFVDDMSLSRTASALTVLLPEDKSKDLLLGAPATSPTGF